MGGCWLAGWVGRQDDVLSTDSATQVRSTHMMPSCTSTGGYRVVGWAGGRVGVAKVDAIGRDGFARARLGAGRDMWTGRTHVVTGYWLLVTGHWSLVTGYC